jgi:prepilin-type N-terminal cleavage/methylation domain-containing protein
MMARRTPRLSESGFTLFEMLVAVAVLAALVGLVPRTLATARGLIDRSQDWVEARLVAEQVLNDELTGRSLRPGTRRGTVDGRRWRAVLQRDLDIPDQTPETGRVLLAVTVEVTVDGAQTLEVETMRIGLSE